MKKNLYSAFRKCHDFAQTNPERYLIFLKEHFTKTTPIFYSIVSKKKIDTLDGIMYAVELIEDIENPSYDAIAKCIINAESVFLWNDHCWGVAVDKAGKQIARKHVAAGDITTTPRGFEFNTQKKSRNKHVFLLFQIGLDPVE
jgi:hypothetical protein